MVQRSTEKSKNRRANKVNNKKTRFTISTALDRFKYYYQIFDGSILLDPGPGKESQSGKSRAIMRRFLLLLSTIDALPNGFQVSFDAFLAHNVNAKSIGHRLAKTATSVRHWQ